MGVRKSIVLLFLLSISCPCAAKEWRGIVPLKSTRTDVERLLGRPKDPVDARYYLPDEIVTIEYSRYACDQVPTAGGWPTQPVRWNVKPDVVTLIDVKPRRPVPLSSLSIDLSSFKRISGVHPVSISYYQDHAAGFTIEVFEEEGIEMVRGYIYEPGAGNESLLCPKTPK